MRAGSLILTSTTTFTSGGYFKGRGIAFFAMKYFFRMYSPAQYEAFIKLVLGFWREITLRLTQL